MRSRSAALAPRAPPCSPPSARRPLPSPPPSGGARRPLLGLLHELLAPLGLRLQARCGRDAGEMQARCGRDVGERRRDAGRGRRDVGESEMSEIWARYGGDVRVGATPPPCSPPPNTYISCISPHLPPVSPYLRLLLLLLERALPLLALALQPSSSSLSALTRPSPRAPSLVRVGHRVRLAPTRTRTRTET